MRKIWVLLAGAGIAFDGLTDLRNGDSWGVLSLLVAAVLIISSIIEKRIGWFK